MQANREVQWNMFQWPASTQYCRQLFDRMIFRAKRGQPLWSRCQACEAVVTDSSNGYMQAVEVIDHIRLETILEVIDYCRDHNITLTPSQLFVNVTIVERSE